MQEERPPRHEARRRGLGDKGQEPPASDDLRRHLGLQPPVGNADDARRGIPPV